MTWDSISYLKINILLKNKNNEEIPEPELVATEEELSVFKNFFNVEGLEDNIQEVVKENETIYLLPGQILVSQRK